MTSRSKIRRVAAGLCSLTALLYLLIGFNIVTIENTITESEQRTFGLMAAAVFAAGAVAASIWDRRWLWAAGAVGLALIMFMYFNIASERDPRFELWGILIRIVQLPLLGSLVVLAATKRTEAPLEPPEAPRAVSGGLLRQE